MPFKVFVDDSGEKDYSKTHPYDYKLITNPLPWGDENTSYWRKNYFVLCGVRIDALKIQSIDRKINDLKREYFGTEDVEVKSIWLRNPKNRKVKYIDKFSIPEERVKEFGEKFIELIYKHNEEIKIIAVVFDKRCIRRRSVYNPLLKTTQMLLERIHLQGQLQNKESVVVFDQMDPKMSVKTGNGKKMLQVYTSNLGMDNIYVEEYSNITDFFPAYSHKENFLQVADVCAYAINKQFMLYGREWLGGTKNGQGQSVLTVDRIFSSLAKNFHCHPTTKQVVGYGLSLFPQEKETRINWNFFK